MTARRLLIVSGSFPDVHCGVSGHVRLTAELTAGRGEYEVHVLTSADAAVKTDLAAGYVVYPLVESWGLGSVNRLCGRILQFAPDIVHIQNPTIKYNGWGSVLMSMLIPALKRRRPDVRVVLTQHDIAISRGALRRRYRPALRRADAILVSNRRDHQAVVAQGIEPAKVHLARVSAHIAPAGRGDDRRGRARARLGLVPDTPCVMYFGYVHPGRNIETLIRAVGLLCKAGRSVCAVIAGGAYRRAEAYYEQCRRLANDLGLDDYVIWTGYATEQQVQDGLAAADVFVSLPERGADMRNTSIITAILGELPVITTRNERYYLDADMDEFGCNYVGPQDAPGLADAIADVLDDPPARQLLRRRAELLAPERVWAQHIDVSLAAYRGEPAEPVRGQMQLAETAAVMTK